MDKYSVTCEPGDIERHRPLATVAYLPFLCFVTLALAPHSKFARYHANQGLILLLAEFLSASILICVELAFLFFHPYGAPIAVIMWLLYLLILTGYITIGLQYGFRGVCEPLPFIGRMKLITWD